MNAVVPGASLITGNKVGEQRAGGARAVVDIWLDANIKTLNVAEYQRYRSYLVSGPVGGGIAEVKE